MFQPTEKRCEASIQRWFGPVAAELGLEIVQVRKSCYEMVSPHFTLRLCLCSKWLDRDERGPKLSAMLVPTDERADLGDDWEDCLSNDEVAVGWVAEYYGAEIKRRIIWSRWDFDREAKQVAHELRTYCLHLFRGESEDWVKIKRLRDAGVRETSRKTRELMSRLPPNVKLSLRKPGESDEEWRQRLLREFKASQSGRTNDAT